MTHGFPVPTVDRDEIINESLAWLKEKNVWSRGRFGAFKYEVGNADHCFIQVNPSTNQRPFLWLIRGLTLLLGCGSR